MNENELTNTLIPIDDSISHMDKITLSSDFYKKLVNGVPVEIDDSSRNLEGKNIRVFCFNNFIGIGIVNKYNNKLVLRMKKVLIGE